MPFLPLLKPFLLFSFWGLTCICRFANKESKYFYNGVNFFLVTLGQENGVWKVVLFSQAPATVIESATPISAPISNDGSYVNSADIEKALNIIRSRYEGVIR